MLDNFNNAFIFVYILLIVLTFIGLFIGSFLDKVNKFVTKTLYSDLNSMSDIEVEEFINYLQRHKAESDSSFQAYSRITPLLKDIQEKRKNDKK
jgi:hypothetical protein